MRISDLTLSSSILDDLDSTRQALVQSQAVMSSGRDVSRPSDDPARAGDAMAARALLAQNGQYQRNVSSGITWLQSADAALTQVSDLAQRARQLLVQANNATMASADLGAVAQELGQIADAVVAAGNTTIEGHYLFAGTATLTAPLNATGSPPSAVTYAGDSGTVVREIGPGITAAVNVSGNQVFTGAQGLMPVLIQAYTDVQSGNTAALSADLQSLDAALDNLTTVRTDVGARLNRLQAADAALQDADVMLTRQLSTAEDADLARVAIRYTSLDTAYRATLSAAGHLLPASLIDFLR